jgi:hypothetical protein
VDKPFFQSFVDLLPAGVAQDRQTILQRFRLHQEANYKQHQPLTELVAAFNELLPLTEEELLEPTAAPAPVAKPAPEPAPIAAVPVVETRPQPVPANPEPRALSKEVPAPQPVATPAPAVAPAPAEKPRVLAEAAPVGVPLYEKLKAEKPASLSLSETLRPERTAASLAEQAPKVETLREAISINQRFSFINELFSGENMEYHAAIQHLDTLPDANAAKRYVTQVLAGKHDWSRKEEHVNKLLKLIDRKFA